MRPPLASTAAPTIARRGGSCYGLPVSRGGSCYRLPVSRRCSIIYMPPDSRSDRSSYDRHSDRSSHDRHSIPVVTARRSFMSKNGHTIKNHLPAEIDAYNTLAKELRTFNGFAVRVSEMLRMTDKLFYKNKIEYCTAHAWQQMVAISDPRAAQSRHARACAMQLDSALKWYIRQNFDTPRRIVAARVRHLGVVLRQLVASPHGNAVGASLTPHPTSTTDGGRLKL
jgi:hypothetical protein